MKLIINGNQEEINDDLTVQDLLFYKNVEAPDTVAVALNGVILNRSKFDTVRVKEKDTIEFLYFMGGGSAY